MRCFQDATNNYGNCLVIKTVVSATDLCRILLYNLCWLNQKISGMRVFNLHLKNKYLLLGRENKFGGNKNAKYLCFNLVCTLYPGIVLGWLFSVVLPHNYKMGGKIVGGVLKPWQTNKELRTDKRFCYICLTLLYSPAMSVPALMWPLWHCDTVTLWHCDTAMRSQLHHRLTMTGSDAPLSSAGVCALQPAWWVSGQLPWQQTMN